MEYSERTSKLKNRNSLVKIIENIIFCVVSIILIPNIKLKVFKGGMKK